MFRIAIVEDEEEAAKNLQSMIERYANENNLEIEIFAFQNPIIFLNNYSAKYDLIFMDIQMPHMDGIEAAEKMRQLDPITLLIFVTNMAYLAGKGYEVQAFDFIVKPIQYDFLALKMERVLETLSRRKEEKIIIPSDGAKVCVAVSSIIYIEVMDHRLIYHTESGDYTTYNTIKKAGQQLEKFDFALCNNCYLVNLRFVKSIRQFVVTVGNAELKISHPKKKSFMEALNNYIGG